MPIAQARVATQAIYRYREPSFKSPRLGLIKRDEIVNIYEEVISAEGPDYNPRWYQLADCFVHSGHLQRVDHTTLNNQPDLTIPESGQLGEITVPYSQTYRFTRSGGWEPLYRLYYQSVHWVTGVVEGPDKNAWYRLTDDLLHIHYHLPAKHVRLISAEELDPISPHVPTEEKRIEVSIEEQTLTTYEAEKIMKKVKVSTGLPSHGPSPNGIPTETPVGRFRVQSKMPCRHMGDGEITADLNAYELLGVPWVVYFNKTGVGFHGTYWHDNFGRRMSHGCVNMQIEDAKWLYRWTTPVAAPTDWYIRGLGTLINIT